MRLLLCWMLLFSAVSLRAADPPYHHVACDGRYPHHLQGVCVDRQHIYWSFTTQLVKTDRAGKVLKKIAVENHHGDLCHVDGNLYVAVNLGKFNDPEGNADSWVYEYDTKELKLLAKHDAQEVFHGAGGIGARNGHFFIVGGLPDGVQENYVYEYDKDFQFVKKHVIPSGHTHLGIQTACYHDDRWWFGCYGSPRMLLVADADFRLVGKFQYDCSLGIVGIAPGRLFSASGECASGKGCSGKLQIVTPDEESGLEAVD